MSGRSPFRFSLLTLLVVTTVVALLAFAANQFRLLPRWQQADLIQIFLWIVIPVAIAMTGMTGGYLSARRSQSVTSSPYLAFLLSGPNWLFFIVVRTTFYLTPYWDFGQEKGSLIEGLEWLANIHGFDVLVVLFQIALIVAGSNSSSVRTTFIGVAIAIFWISLICAALLSCALSGIYIGPLR